MTTPDNAGQTVPTATPEMADGEQTDALARGRTDGQTWADGGRTLLKAFPTRLVESGADVKTVQELARHSDPRITLAIYAKAREERLTLAAENVGRALLAQRTAS